MLFGEPGAIARRLGSNQETGGYQPVLALDPVDWFENGKLIPA